MTRARSAAEENRRRREREEQDDQGERPETVNRVLCFDGAFRAGRPSRSAWAVFDTVTTHHESGFSKSEEICVENALQAEIVAATRAVEIARRVCEASVGRRRVTSFTIRGDSQIVINAIRSGDILRSDYKKAALPNDTLWGTLKDNIACLHDGGCEVLWEWVPRAQNKEADEMCNATLDKRPVNKEVKSAQKPLPIPIVELDKLCDLLISRRRPTVKALPQQLQPLWANFIFQVLGKYDADPARTRILFLLAPHLLTVGLAPFIAGRADFRAFRQHIYSLCDEVYLQNVLHRLIVELSEPQSTNPTAPTSVKKMTSTHIASLCARGQFSKIYKDNDVTVPPFSKTMEGRIKSGFPEAELPPKLPFEPDEFDDVTFAEVRGAFKKLRFGKAPGVTGWNRELLNPVISNPPPLVRAIIAQMFTAFASTAVSSTERKLLTAIILIPFTYIGRPEKVRSILITDSIVRLCWHIVFAGVDDPNVNASSQVIGKAGQTTLAVTAAQAALAAGETIVSCDAVNAFPTLHRSTFMQYVQRHPMYKRTKGMLNLFYAAPVTARWYSGGATTSFEITQGVLQGCVSGPRLYSIGTVAVNKSFGSQLIQVADDIVIRGPAALATAPAVFQSFAEIGQVLNGPKLKIIHAANAPALSLATLHPSLQGAIVEAKPQMYLGGVITPRGSAGDSMELNACAEKIITKVRAKLEEIVRLDTTKQCKYLILRQYAKSLLYRAQTFFHPAATVVFEQFDSLFLAAIMEMLPRLKTLDPTIRTQSPIEDGGLGIYCYGAIQPWLLGQTVRTATGYLRMLGLEYDAPPTPHSSLLSAWKAHMPCYNGGRPERDGRSFRKGEFPSWLECRPKNMWTRMDDETFETQIDVIFQNLEPSAGRCIFKRADGTETELQLLSLAPKDFTHHVITCARCTQKGFFMRHQAVLNAVRQTCRFHGVHSFVPSATEFPLPDKERGGPDLIVYGSNQSKVFAVDVTVVCTHTPEPGQSIRARMSDAFAEKMRQYEKFKSLTQYEVAPFVMSVYGVVAKETREIVETWRVNAPDPSFLADLYANVQFSLLKAQNQMIHYVKRKYRLQSEKNSWILASG